MGIVCGLVGGRRDAYFGAAGTQVALVGREKCYSHSIPAAPHARGRHWMHLDSFCDTAYTFAMRTSKLLIPTTREIPAEAEIPSHQLMIRAGFVRKVASGTYTYLPLGLRTLRKISQIVREEMDASGAQEIDMPFVQPMELWDQGTGRRADYGATLGCFTDRHGRENVLSPTAEEVVTSLVAAEINSYRQLPINLYQIKTKYRDEFRPRFGVLRSREFVMKDAYSFDATLEGLQKSYDAMHAAYCRIFDRCGVPYVVVQAQAGEIGGEGSEEFMIPCDAGEPARCAAYQLAQ